MKPYERKLVGSEGEREVSRLLKMHGRTVESMPVNHHFDLLVDGLYKIEVKTARPKIGPQECEWQFKLTRNGELIEVADFYILRLKDVPFSKAAIHLLMPCPQGVATVKVTFRGLLNGMGYYAGAFRRFCAGNAEAALVAEEQAIIKAACAFVRHEGSEGEGITDLWASNSNSIPCEFMALVEAVDAFEGRGPRGETAGCARPLVYIHC